MKLSLKELSELIGGNLSGGGNIIVTGPGDIDTAKEGQVAFIKDKSYLERAKNSGASAFIVPFGFNDMKKPVIEVENPYIAFTKVLDIVFKEKLSFYRGIHKTAEIGGNVRMGKDVSVGPYSVIGDGSVLLDGATVCSQVYIGARVIVGKNCVIYPNASIREDSLIGNNVIIQCGAVIGSDGDGFIPRGESYIPVPQVGRVVIEDDVKIGANSTIDRGTIGETRIGKGTKIDNQVHVAHNVKVGENSMLLAHVTIAGSTQIGKHAIFSGQSGTIDNLKIGDNVVAGSCAGILQDMPDNSVVWGIPAIPIQEQKRIAVASRKLPEALREIKELKDKVRELEEKLKK